MKEEVFDLLISVQKSKQSGGFPVHAVHSPFPLYIDSSIYNCSVDKIKINAVQLYNRFSPVHKKLL